jgi:hypothetical protein
MGRMFAPAGRFQTTTPPRAQLRPRRTNGASAPRYFIKPKWGSHTGYSGGTRMEVWLGPAASLSVNRGSVPLPGTPSVMKLLKIHHPAFRWKAGHLLNADLGGPGVAQNLTPLTIKANRAHSTYENRIKNALTVAWRLSQNGTDPYWYGIHYTVEVLNGSFGPNRPLKSVRTGIKISAEVVQVAKAPGSGPQTAATNPLGFSVFSNVRILNR